MMTFAKEFEGELWVKASDYQQKLTEAVAAEREACAMVVEDVEQSPNPIINMTNRLAAAAIRARGQQ